MRDPRLLTAAYRPAIDGYLSTASPARFPGRPAADRLLAASLFDLGRRVRSPLEALFGVRLIEALARRAAVGWDPRPASTRFGWSASTEGADGVRRVRLACNFRVDRCVFDFWIRSDELVDGGVRQRTTLVECDGAAWHWGRQLDLDRRKDELADELDWCMFRIPSAKILADPVGRADEVVDYVLDGSFLVGGLVVDRSDFRRHCSET